MWGRTPGPSRLLRKACTMELKEHYRSVEDANALYDSCGTMILLFLIGIVLIIGIVAAIWLR